MKRFIQLTLLLLALLLPATAAAYSFKVNGIYYSITSSSDKTVAVTYQNFYRTDDASSIPSGYVYDVNIGDDDTDFDYSCSDYSGQIVIPSSVYYNGNTYQVTSITSWAFMNCLNVSSITIPNSITSINSEAFRNCSCQSLTIPSSVTDMGRNLFDHYTGSLTVNCSTLRFYGYDNYYEDYRYYSPFKGGNFSSLTLGDNVTAIPEETFMSCSNLVSATLSGNIATIGNNAFSGCSKLAAIDIDNSSLSSIGSYAFSYCSQLKAVNISNLNKWLNCTFSNSSSSPFYNGADLYISNAQVTNLSIPITTISVPSFVFCGCTGLTSISIPNSVTSIGQYAFSGCTSLTSAIIPSSVTTVGQYAFSGCTSLTSATITNAMGQSVYSGCTGLTSVIITSSVTSFNESTLSGCNGLTSITVESGNATYDSRNDCNAVIETASNTLITGCQSTTIPNSVTIIGNSAFSGCSGLTSVTIPNSVTTIGTKAFYNCTGLTSVFIPNSVTDIGSSAFSGCTGLTSVTIPNSVTAIEGSVFSGCTGLTSVTIPNSVTSIGNSAFYNCSGLTEATIGSSITTIGNYAFQGCSSLATLNFNAVSCADFNSSQYYRPFKDLNISTINIGDGVQSVPAYFAYSLKNLSNLTISNSVTTIGSYAFSGCSGIKNLTWNAINCSSNGNMPTSNIKNVTIGNEVQILPNYFVSDSKITSITIPNSVNTIGSSAFSGCSSLKNLTWNAINCSSNGNMATSNLENIIIGNEVQSLPSSFAYSSKITSITIPNSVTTIGSSAFFGCSGLTGITIPTAVNSIGNNAFSGCTGLTSVTIPNSVTAIKGSVFYNCTGLTSVTIPNSVTTIGSSAFYNCRALSDIIIGKGVTTINSNAFNDCNIKALRYNAVNCSSIATDAFKADVTLSSLQFGDSVEYIPAGLPTFDMTGANLLIPNSVQSIASGALSSGVCDAVVISNSLNSLEAGTFSEGIKVAYVSNAEPIPSAPAAFADPQTLYVPGGSKVKYWTAQGWNEFKEIIQGPYIPVDGLAIDSVISMPKGATRQIASTISPTDATATSIKWFSKDSSIATVDSNGLIQAIDHGETDIYAIVDTVMAICHVNVNVALVEALTLNATQLLLEPDAIYTLTAIANPDYAENKDVEWEIPENDVIVHFISGNNINIGTLQEGTITVSAHTLDGSDLTATCTITVNQNIVHVTSIELNQSSAGLNEGETLQLTATVMPEDATNRSVTWTSSNEVVATVDQNGLVTAVAAGTATITATTIDGSELSASCEVTVNGVATVNNTLDADALSARCGEEKQLAVRMDNESSITALQCDIYLPEGVSIATEDGDYLIDLVPARKAANHTVSTNDLPNGAIRLFITSATSKPFKGNSGDVFILNLVVDGDAESGEYSLDLRNIILSDTEAHPYYAPDLNVPVTVLDYIKGDVNIDGTVNVSDYVATANYILEMDPHPFLFAAADIDENLTINVSDLVGVANIALNFMGAPAIYHAPAMGYGGAGLMSFTANCSTISPNRHVVTLDLSNSSAVTAFQMDINLPDGLKLVDASLSDRATASHSLEMTTLASGAYRLLGASMMSKAFAGSEGALLTLEIEGDASGAAVIDGIMLAEPDATLHRQDAIILTFDDASGVHEMYNEVRIYTEDGKVVVESPIATKVQFILPNGMSLTKEVKSGRNVYDTGFNGVVIVKVDTQVKKFKL